MVLFEIEKLNKSIDVSLNYNYLNNSKVSLCTGLPYMGNKQSIATEIINVIKNENPNIHKFYDLFGGGGSVSFEALRNNYRVFYNEINKGVYELQKLCRERVINKEFSNYGILPEEYYEFVSKNKFDEIIRYICGTHKTAYEAFVGLVYSFSNNLNGWYFCAAENETLKKSIHNFCVYNDKDGLIKQYRDVVKNIDTSNLTINERRSLLNLKGCNRVQELERINMIENYKYATNFENLNLSNYSYDEVLIEKDSVLYCDIPYTNCTRNYQNEIKNDDGFDRQRFVNWCKYKATEGFIIYVSEFQFPIGKIVWQKQRFEHVSRKKSDTENRIEKLFKVDKETINIENDVMGENSKNTQLF